MYIVHAEYTFHPFGIVSPVIFFSVILMDVSTPVFLFTIDEHMQQLMVGNGV